MRILITLAAGIILLMASTATLAADRITSQRDQVRDIQHSIFMDQSHATLARSPYYSEIQKVNDQTEHAELALLAELRTATDEERVIQIINCLERLEVERELDVLRIQARYARGAGMLDLEMKIRARILHIMEEEHCR
ncbi:MAG: hypothetical protein KOO60_13310 [Gemmatimonadales bacterium]|nr:hypothetical protein [Gemmatimonadales bacterium]